MDIWQTASPAEPVHTGWIGRWLDSTGDDPLRAVNIGTVLPPLAVDGKCTAAALPASEKPEPVDRFAQTMYALGVDDPNDTRDGSGLRRVSRHPHHRHDLRRDQAAWREGREAQLTGRQLDMVAAVQAAVPTRVYAVSLGGFDTHANERETQQRLLQTLDEAVTPFLAQMAGDRSGK